jgi:hypothetical protein
MAVELLAASSEHYYRSASLSGDVFTFAAWAYVSDLTTDRVIICAADSSATAEDFYQIRYDNSTNDFRFLHDDATASVAISTITPQANTWYHIVGSTTGLSSRTIWVNGGDSDTSTSTRTSISSLIDNIAVGAFRDVTPGNYFNGRIFMPAIWQGWAATAEDALAMSKGVPPWRFAPDKLIFLTPLASADGTPRDWISGTALTVNGTPTTAEGPHVMSDGGVLIPKVETIWDVTPSASTRASGSLALTDPSVSPSMTTAQNGSMGIAVFLNDSARNWSSPTQSYTNEVEASTPQEAVAMYSKQLPTAGLQSGVQATLSGDQPWVAHQFALAKWGGGDVEFVAGASASNASALSLSVNKPTGAQEGDYLIVVVHHNSDADTINDDEAGYPFDEDFQETAPVATSQYAIFSRQLTATEPTSYQFTSTGVASRVQISAAAFRSVAPPPSITDVANSGETPGSGTETWDDGSTGNVITGTNFL